MLPSACKTRSVYSKKQLSFAQLSPADVVSAGVFGSRVAGTIPLRSALPLPLEAWAQA